jgi:predicted nucleic acid-binding protein
MLTRHGSGRPRQHALAAAEVAITAITAAELLYGVDRQPNGG